MAIEAQRDRKTEVVWGTKHRLLTGVNVSVSAILAVLAVILANYLAAGQLSWRLDIGKSRFYELSEKTRQILDDSDQDISVYAVFHPNDSSDDDVDVLTDIKNLLREYALYSERSGGRILFEWIDPHRDLARAEVMRQRYGATGDRVVIFDAGGQVKVVPEREIVEYEYVERGVGGESKRTKIRFRGEQAFTSAIVTVTDEEKPVLYFVRGHGERDLADFTANVGYAQVATALRMDNLETRSVYLAEQGVPPDCDMLVVAGPQKAFHSHELETMKSYLVHSGSLLVLMDAGVESGLEALLEEWGVELPREKVVGRTIPVVYENDSWVRLPGSGEELYVRRYGDHAITKGLKDVTTQLYMPRTVQPVRYSSEGAADRPSTTALGSCTEAGWAETDFGQEPAEFDEGIDRPGPISIAVASERGAIAGVDVLLKSTRLVVIGDSDFVANDRLAGGNQDLLLNSVNWLLDREALVGIGPKTYARQYLWMSDRQVGWFFGIVGGILPLMVVLFGVGVWMRRAN